MTVSESSPPPFAVHARQIVRSLRGSFAEVLASAGADPTSHPSIMDAIGINKNLAWRLSKVIQDDDPMVVFQHMPGSSGLKIFLKAARKSGVDASRVSTAEEAIGAYESFIRIHSGDRATMQMMSSSLSAEVSTAQDEQHRKMLFQGASYVWGAQARVLLKVALVGPGAEPGLADIALLNGMIDFRRLRPDVPWVMAARSANNDDGSMVLSPRTEPVDVRYPDPEDAPLMADFCSDPLPEMRAYAEDGFTSFELVEGEIGNTGAQTCVFGTIQRNLPMHRTPMNEWGRHTARCDTPSEQMIVDVFFHESFEFAMHPETSLVSHMGTSPPSPSSRIRTLPLHEKLQDLGVGSLPVVTPEVRDYNVMVQALFDRMEWQPREFHGFRMSLAFPPVPTALVLQYRLPSEVDVLRRRAGEQENR